MRARYRTPSLETMQTGVSDAQYEAAESAHQSSPHRTTSVPITQRQKRRRGDPDLAVIADSEDEDEDYGWANEDGDSLPPLPSQWQGSEDLIIGQDLGLSEDEADDAEIAVASKEAPSSDT